MFRLILIRLLESYFHHRWLYLLPIVLMMGGAFLYTFLQEPLYLSEGILHVQRDSLINTLTIGTNSGITWDTPAEEAELEIDDLLKTDAFVRAIVSQTDLESKMSSGPDAIEQVLTDVREAVYVSPEGDDQLLVAAEYTDPLVAHQLVNAIVDNYVNWQINVQLSESANAQEFFTELTQEYENDLEYARQELDAYLIAHSEPERGARSEIEVIQISRLEDEVQMAGERYANSIDNEELARLAMIQAENTIKQSYFLMDAPKVPTSAESSLKDILISAGIFIMVGFLISCVGIVGGALLDRSFRVPLDVTQILELPTLATVPDVSKVLAKKYQVSKKITLDKSSKDNKQSELSDPQLAS